MECMMNRQIVVKKESSGSYSETWVWNETIYANPNINTPISWTIPFKSPSSSGIEKSYSSIGINSDWLGGSWGLVYDGQAITIGSLGSNKDNFLSFTPERKITFLEPPTGDLLTFLQANAVKQPSDQAIQTDKSITITSNGTTTIRPDVPYDALSEIEVDVDVSGGSGTKNIIITPYLYGEQISTWSSTGINYLGSMHIQTYENDKQTSSFPSLEAFYGRLQEGQTVNPLTITNKADTFILCWELGMQNIMNISGGTVYAQTVIGNIKLAYIYCNNSAIQIDLDITYN